MAGRRELYAALDADVPLILVHEADESKGGAPLDAMKAECREQCTDRPGASGEGVCAKVFNQEPVGSALRTTAQVWDVREPIVWVRVHDFQLGPCAQ